MDRLLHEGDRVLAEDVALGFGARLDAHVESGYEVVVDEVAVPVLS
jgi:hypothetical protein